MTNRYFKCCSRCLWLMHLMIVQSLRIFPDYCVAKIWHLLLRLAVRIFAKWWWEAQSAKEAFVSKCNGPYSLFICASYYISCSVHARFASVTFIDCKWRWECSEGSATLNFHWRDSGIFRFLAWFRDSCDSCLPYKGLWIAWFITYGEMLNIQSKT